MSATKTKNKRVPSVDDSGRPLSSGAYIRIHRCARGLTQEKLGRLMNKVTGAIQAWEADASKPKAADVPKLAKHLGVDAVELSTFINATHRATAA